MFIKKLCSCLAIVLTVSCGGGGGSAASSGGNPPVANERMGGIWQGTSTAPGNNQSIIGVTLDDGRFRFLSLTTEGQFVGTMSVSNQNRVTGNGFGIAPAGFTWTGGSTVTTLSIAGTVAERSSFDGTWATGTGESGFFNMSFDPIYNRISSLAKVQGTYTSYDDFGNATASFTFGAEGGVSGQDIGGCVYGGQLSIVDSSVNVYQITLVVSNCGQFNSTYSGLGILIDFNGTDDELLISVDDSIVYAIFGMLR